jgi:hypothetical protein
MSLNEMDSNKIHNIYNAARNTVLNTEDNLTALKHEADTLFCNTNEVFLQELKEAENLVFVIMNETLATQKYLI